ncbi:MAG TPA: Uma2 family endonuclease, partial [Pirellula sp.]|nr:Uma2 family endonuclease [Pirellula sp.]
EIAPEICVEVRSPSHTPSEIQTKRYLYFEAGAEEVWICELDGLIEFYIRTDPENPLKKSIRCDTFSSKIE